MADRIVRNWWALGARGAAAILFGLLVLTLPESALTVGSFAWLFAIYALVDGVLTLLTAARYRSRARDVAGPRDLVLVAGVAGTTLGLAILFWPDPSTAVLLGILAAWAAATGVPEVLLARRQRRKLPVPALLAGSGAVQLVLALVLVGAVALGVVRVGWEIGAATIVAGALRVALASRSRRVRFAPRVAAGDGSARNGAEERDGAATGETAPGETAPGETAPGETAPGVAA